MASDEQLIQLRKDLHKEIRNPIQGNMAGKIVAGIVLAAQTVNPSFAGYATEQWVQDQNFATQGYVETQINNIQIDNSNWSGTPLSIFNGGTGATSAAAARIALGLAPGVDIPGFSDLPTLTSELTNDSGFITSASLSAVAISNDYNDLLNLPTIPTNNNQLTNGAGFVTAANVASQVNATFINALDIDAESLGGVDSVNYALKSYVDGSIPTLTSELTNDSGFITSASLSPVATSNDYNDLLNLPTIPTNNNQLTNGSGFITSANVAFLNGTAPFTAAQTFNGGITIGAGQVINNNTDSSRDKIRVWSTSEYVIGMGSSYTFGGISNYAMTFQMNNTNSRGFWWGDDAHSNAQGAMSLTTDGKLNVASSLRLGYGESDTSAATATLQVSGATELNGATTINGNIVSSGTLTATGGTATPLSVTTSATGNYTPYRANTTDLRGYIGTGVGLITGAVAISMALRAESGGAVYLGIGSTAYVDVQASRTAITNTLTNGASQAPDFGSTDSFVVLGDGSFYSKDNFLNVSALNDYLDKTATGLQTMASPITLTGGNFIVQGITTTSNFEVYRNFSTDQAGWLLRNAAGTTVISANSNNGAFIATTLSGNGSGLTNLNPLQMNGIDYLDWARTDVQETFNGGLIVNGGDLQVNSYDITTSAWMKTGAPSGGSVSKFKIGRMIATSTVALDTGKYVQFELENGGVLTLAVVSIVGGPS